MDSYFEHTLFVDKLLIRGDLKKIEKSHGGSLNQWFGDLMHITVQTCYDIQYLTMRLSDYMNAPIEPSFLLSDMAWNTSYTIHMNPSCTQERKFIKLKKSPTNITSKQEIQKSKNQEYSNFLHTYCDADHARDLADRLSVTSAFHILNGTLIDWCSKKKSKTWRRSSNS